MPLTQEQVKIIKSTIPVLKEHGDAITLLFYSTLLREKPSLNNVFNQANQANGHQAQSLAGALYAYANFIDDLGVLSPAVEAISQKHVSLYITEASYAVVGEYLLRAMGEVLGAALTPAILEAWGAAYWQLANIMIKREAVLTAEREDWTDWRVFRIARKVKESDEITSFYLEPVDGKTLPAFLPGQYISVMTDVAKLGYSQARQYSLSDAPKPNYYRISVRRASGLITSQPGAEAHPGFISNILHDDKDVGDTVSVSHPAGVFTLDPKAVNATSTSIVLISAGVGATPMMSMLNTLVDRKSTQHISYIHGARSASAQPFRQHVHAMTQQHANVSASLFIKAPASSQTDDKGLVSIYGSRINLAILDHEKDLCLDDARTKYFICGPDTFMSDISDQLMALGVDAGRIQVEKFGTGPIPRSASLVMGSTGKLNARL